MKIFIEAIRKILKLDYSRIWKEEFLKDLIGLFLSKNESKIYAGLTIFYQLSKLYEYESTKNRIDYEFAFEKIFPYLTEFFNNVKLKLDDEVCIIILKKILKIVYKTINSDIPTILLDFNNFSTYINTLNEIITNLNGVDKTIFKSSEELLSTNIWKCGLLCFQILFRIISKYGNPLITDNSRAKALSNIIKEKHQIEILKVFFIVLEKSLFQLFPDKIMCIIFKYLAHLIEKANHVNLITPHLDIFLSDFIVQNAMLSSSDLLLRTDDEKSYIYKIFDLAVTFHDRRYACSSFVKALCEYKEYDNKTKKYLEPFYFKRIYDFLISMFSKYDNEKKQGKNPNPLIKEALMHLFESISFCTLGIVKHEELEEIIKIFILPEMIDENNSNKYSGVLKEKGACVIKLYSSLKYKDINTLNSVVQVLCKLLVDQDLSVRVVTSITLPVLMRHPEVKNLLEPYIKDLLEQYLKLMNSIDLEELLVGLENIITHFGEKVVDYAIDLSKELVIRFEKLINKNVDENNGESHLAAEGVIKAANRVCLICCNNSVLIIQVEKIIKPIIKYSLSGEGFEYIDEGLDIIRSLTKNTSNISKETWEYFTLINFSIIGDEEENNKILEQYPNTALEGIGYDGLEEHLNVLINYLNKEIKTFCLEKDQYGKLFIDRMFQTLFQILKNSIDDIDVSNSVICCKVFNQIIDSATLYNKTSNNKAINIDKYLTLILNYFFNTIKTTKQQTYKNGLYEILSSSLLYDTKLTLDFLFNKGELENIMNLWFVYLNLLIKNEKEINKNIYGLTNCLLFTTSFQQSYNLNPTKFISILVKKLFTLIQNLDKLEDKRYKNNEKGIDGIEDSEDEITEDNYNLNINLKKVTIIK